MSRLFKDLIYMMNCIYNKKIFNYFLIYNILFPCFITKIKN